MQHIKLIPLRHPTAVWLLFMLVLAAKGFSTGMAEPSTALELETESVPQEESSPNPESIERGRVIVEGACTICHDLDLVEEQRLDREGWGYVIQAMLANGSDLADREIPFVLDYLSTAYPAGSADQQ